MRKKKKRHIGLKLFLVLLLLIAAVGGYFALMLHRRDTAPGPETVYAAYVRDYSPAEPETETGALLAAAAREVYRLEPGEVTGRGLWERSMPVTAYTLDAEQVAAGLDGEIQAALSQAAASATRLSDLYDEQLRFKPELTERAFREALEQRLASAGDCLRTDSVQLRFRFDGSAWELKNSYELEGLIKSTQSTDWDACAQELTAQAGGDAPFIPISYSIDEQALSGPEPDQSRFGQTEDPAEIQALLETPLARMLIGDRELAWRPDLNFIPGRPIRYYLDESLLVLVWQEPSSRAVGTFSEVITADGSQLRRRIAGDAYQSFDFETTTAFSEKTNGVLTLGGDFYHHDRACGIVVYQRDIYRFDPDSCDTCYITADGDMLFSYRGQFGSIEEAQAFIEDNDVLFSLCFGPVLIDGGVDVTPDQYPWGEIHDVYARSVLGMLGPRHYLTVNINCQQPDYYYLVTLRQAADAVIEKGCVKAYALDGGQTATTVFNGQLINPVQFGWEKMISDVIYFATAVPAE